MDVLEVVADDVDRDQALLWLKSQTFIEARSMGYQYHQPGRRHMLDVMHRQSQQNWKRVHETLADWYEGRRAAAAETGARRWDNGDWRAYAEEALYHGLCASLRGAESRAVAETLDAFMNDTSIARRWADVIRQAGEDSGSDSLLSLGGSLADSAARAEADGDWAEFVTQLVDSDQLPTKERERAYRARAWCHESRQRLELAVVDYSHALELEPESARALMGRSQCNARLGRRDSALADLDSAIAMGPNVYCWKALRCDLLLDMDRPDEALEYLDQIAKRHPDDAGAFAHIGAVRQRVRQYDQAIAI